MSARLTSFALIVSITCGAYAYDVTVRWNEVHQKISGFGAGNGCGGAYSNLNPGTGEGWNIRRLPEPARTECLNLLFDSTKGIGLNCFRFGESWELEDPDGTWHWGAGRGPQEVWIAKEALKRNSNMKFWSAPWTPPLWMKTEQTVGGGALQRQYYQRYADYKCRFIREMKEKEGIQMMGNSLQNEPHFNPSYGGCNYTPENIRDFVRDYFGPTLVREGLADVKIMIPESNEAQPQWAQAAMNDPEAAKYVGILAWHQYNDGNQPYFGTVEGKETWFTEVGHDPWGGMGYTGWNEALWVHNQLYGAIVNNDANSWSYYQFAGDGNGGLAAVDGANFDVTAKDVWWVGHYSKFVRPGWVRIGTSVKRVGDGAMLSAFKDPMSGRFAFVIANEGISKPGPTITVTCDGFAPRKVSAYLTPGEDQAVHLQGPTDVPIVNGKFTYTVPNVSIATLVGETQAVGTERAIATQTPVRMHAMRVPLGLRVVMDQPVRGRAELLDSRGRMVAQWDIAAVAQQTLRLSRPLSNGVHMLRVRDNGEHDGYIGVVN